jgi:hypothetical protein
MAAGNWILYDTTRLNIGNSVMDMDNDTFRIILCDNTNTGITASSLSYYSDVTTELSTANGYTAGGEALTSVTWTYSGFTATFDSANKQWTAAGGSIGAQYAVIYDHTSSNSELVCHCLLDTTPSLVTATDGNTFTVAMNASGIFTLSGATK